MNFLVMIPIPALIFLIFLVISIIVILVFLIKNRKSKEEKNELPEIQLMQPEVVQAQQEVTGDMSLPQTQPETPPPSISVEPVKENEEKYLILIIIASGAAILIPLLVSLLIKTQTLRPAVPTTTQISQPACTAITITDTLGKSLSESELQNLRPQDEIKILITASNQNISKARFRVNGSLWQEVTIKEGNNFVGNYILDMGIKKFTIEAEVYDKEKGWL